MLSRALALILGALLTCAASSRASERPFPEVVSGYTEVHEPRPGRFGWPPRRRGRALEEPRGDGVSEDLEILLDSPPRSGVERTSRGLVWGRGRFELVSWFEADGSVSKFGLALLDHQERTYRVPFWHFAGAGVPARIRLEAGEFLVLEHGSGFGSPPRWILRLDDQAGLLPVARAGASLLALARVLKSRCAVRLEASYPAQFSAEDRRLRTFSRWSRGSPESFPEAGIVAYRVELWPDTWAPEDAPPAPVLRYQVACRLEQGVLKVHSWQEVQ